MKQKIEESSQFSLEIKWKQATPVSYARFHQEVPRMFKVEPVAEFKLESKDAKYIVGSMRWSWGDGLLFLSAGKIRMIPAANVQYHEFV